MQKLAKDIYVETAFPGVTVGAVVTREGIVCIDAPTHPADARRWRLKLAQLSPKPVLYVINLDHHRDRVAGSQWFEAPVIAHEATSERLRQLPELFKGAPSESGAEADLSAELNGVRLVLPQVSFTERMRLALDGHDLHLVHRPGSAPGAIWVELPNERIVFTGDSVTLGVPPPMQEVDLQAWLATLAQLRRARFPAKVIVPGRGGPTDKQGLKPMEDFLKLARRRLEALARAKKTRADAAALAEPLLALFSVPASMREHCARRLRMGLERLYDQLTAQ
ncbi:MAG: MBL fold metallo-hydrolase [Anaerolineales bacterium]|nr:MBL fold metallo-hydrolase [Anaerolineales bacterium]